jgi:hypothetical protein
MSTAPPLTTTEWTAADLVRRVGPIPLSRIRTRPDPGTATERDVETIHDRESRLCEWVDGILVEKTVDQFESAVATHLGAFLVDSCAAKGLAESLAPMA